MKHTIIYIGGFQLPDKNAAAQRVVGIAKALKAKGHEVIFINYVDWECKTSLKSYFGIECIEEKKPNNFDYIFTGKQVEKMLSELKPDAVIAYNYPAFALNRVVRYCKKKNIKCFADITEWYEPHGNFIHRLIMKVDIGYRMNYVLYRMTGIIAISKYIFEIYNKRINTIMVPPLVDMKDEKWKNITREPENTTRFVYAGIPIAQKESLKLIIDCIGSLSKTKAIQLDVVGLSEDEYRRIYKDAGKISECVHFTGRTSHEEALWSVKRSDWSIIIRENSRLVKAGFPTKFVESIACGTPVIANEFSNITDFLNKSNGLLADINDIESSLRQACNISFRVEDNSFDYHKYEDVLDELLQK